MITCIIVDDELKSRESLQILLTDFCQNVEVLALCQNVDEGIKAIKKHHPNIVFLDIQLQGETGFELFERMPSIDFEVIFTTAYSEYALKAFRFSAIDYLLKPIDIEDLKKSIGKVETRLNRPIIERMQELFQNLRNESNGILKIALPTSDGLVFVDIKEILYCEASSNYTTITLQDNVKYVISRTLKEYEDLLQEYSFFRIHNSHIINLNAIKKYVRGEGGYVVMSNNQSLDVSKRRKELFLKKLGH